MANFYSIGLLVFGMLFPQISFAFRVPSSVGHSEFFEKCQQGLVFHPQMSMAPLEVLSDSGSFCQCAQKEFESVHGDMNWPNFDRNLLLNSYDKCLGSLYIDKKESYQWIGSILFDLWIGRDLEQRLLQREPAGIGHFVSLDDLINERQCVRDGMIKKCFDGSLSHSHRCLLDQVSDPDLMNDWSMKCKTAHVAVKNMML